jgi:hypothetical protein
MSGFFFAQNGPSGIAATTAKQAEPAAHSKSAAAGLQIYGPMLGRPSDRSITVNVVNQAGRMILLEYGSAPEDYDYRSGPFRPAPGEQAVDLTIRGLKPNTRYYYRVCLVSEEVSERPFCWEGSFQTSRPRGVGFTFAVTSDAHQYMHNYGQPDTARALNIATLENIAEDRPDFLIDLGDLIDQVRSIRRPSDPFQRYLDKRAILSRITHSVPFYLVLGNHEGEQGWRVGGGDPIAEWCALARKALIPNPFPDDFYSGNRDFTECCGLREDYYAWEWGDALFVILDPFWYTSAEPSLMGARDGWDWTLGRNQYNWLHSTLRESSSRWKLVFIHHLIGGLAWGEENPSFYGRGGIEVVKYAVAGRPTFEWGGEDKDGHLVFEEKRTDWQNGPIHDMMVREGVTVVFHGHDHGFVYQELDGMVYQECPRPNDIRYLKTLIPKAGYTEGIQQPSSGHIRVKVTPDSLRVAYVRSVLPGDEPLLEDGQRVSNGSVTYSYTIKDP